MVITLKIRPAWSGKKGSGGAIISLPAKLRKEAGLNVGDYVSISLENGKLTMTKMILEE